jgi:hypothetical protein
MKGMHKCNLEGVSKNLRLETYTNIGLDALRRPVKSGGAEAVLHSIPVIAIRVDSREVPGIPDLLANN